jgi:catechol-2,3-dioxygenase
MGSITKFQTEEEETQMNTEAIVHPKLLHYGLATGNMDAMSDWYRKVLGMTVNHRSKIPAIAPDPPRAALFRFLIRLQ